MFITIILFNLASTLGYLVCITYGTSLHGSNELQFEWWKFSILWIIYGENHNVDIFTLIFVNKIIPRLYDDTGIWIIFCKLFCKREESFQIHIIDVHTPTSNFTPLRFVIFLGLLKLDRTCGLLTTQSRNSMILLIACIPRESGKITSKPS